MEKKTHFVRDFLQNSYRQLIHQHHLQSHLQCGNDPTVANHNGILSTAHARNTVETPFTMRNRSENGPRMIRAWSENDPTTHETVSQPSHRRGRSSRFGDGLCRRKFRSQTSDNMERWKAEQGRGREKRKIRREKIRRERVRRQKIQMREKVGKSRNTVFFQWFVAPEGRKVGSLKRRVRSQLATGAIKNCTPLWCEAHFEVKSVKNWRSRTTFGSWDVKKVHAVVARSTFPSQNVQNTSASDHFWKLRCRKSARRCGAKPISKSKCTKH